MSSDIKCLRVFVFYSAYLANLNVVLAAQLNSQQKAKVFVQTKYALPADEQPHFNLLPSNAYNVLQTAAEAEESNRICSNIKSSAVFFSFIQSLNHCFTTKQIPTYQQSNSMGVEKDKKSSQEESKMEQGDDVEMKENGHPGKSVVIFEYKHLLQSEITN